MFICAWVDLKFGIIIIIIIIIIINSS